MLVRPLGSEPLSVIGGHVPRPLTLIVRVGPLDVPIWTVAALGPGVPGWNCTTKLVFAPPLSTLVLGAPRPKSPAFAPVRLNVGSVRGVGSEFVSVSAAAAREPGVTVPKSIDGGLMDSPPVPVPINGIVTAPLTLFTVNAAVSGVDREQRQRRGDDSVD